MDKVVILQSFREAEAASDGAGWQQRCMDSVRGWAASRGYAYEFCGDELFERLPRWYAEKVGTRRPIAADLARLLWIEDVLLSEQADVAVWLDADVFVMAPAVLDVALHTSCVFGHEYWWQAHEGRRAPVVRKNVHNAYCAFRRGCPILPFLIEATQRMIERVDPEFIAPQFVGPKLLTSLHNIVGFELDPRFGAISPLLADALRAAPHEVPQRLRAALPVPVLAANLCASLQTSEGGMQALLDVLEGFKSGLR